MMTDVGSCGHLTLDALRTAVESGEIDTVVLAMVDMQGRLQGKRLMAKHFLDEIVESRAEGCKSHHPSTSK